MIRFFNGRVLSMDGGMDISDNEVWTDADKISYVGPKRSDMPWFEREIDLKGDLLMPGFKNAHAHTAMTFVRSLADDMPLQPWLFGKIIPLEQKLTPENVYTFTRLGILEYLSSGITAAFDMYYHRSSGAQACIDSGFRYVFCGQDGSIEQVEDEYTRFNSLHPLISMLCGIHAEYTVPVENMKIVAQVAHRHHAPFFTHNSETASEVRECVERHGMTPTELYDSLGLFDYGGGGYHCVYLSEHDMEIFKKRGLWVVSCPASNAKLASGVAPLTEFKRRGISLALGTDGASSNNALDMFREMYLACVLQKLKNNDAAACDADYILSAACSGGARAMGLDNCDCIAVGKQADMIVIDLNRPNMRPIVNPSKNLVYSGSKENIRLTMVAGRVLYEDGEFFIGDEPGKIYEDTEKMLRELMEK